MSNTIADVPHRDSIGTMALVERGRVAVMNAGNGIAHSENSRKPMARCWSAPSWGWGLPESARHGEHSFVLHQTAPVRNTAGLRATVFVGHRGTTVAHAQGVTPRDVSGHWGSAFTRPC